MILPTPSRYNPALALAWACALFLCACQPDKPEASSGSAGAKHYFSMQLESHPVFLQLGIQRPWIRWMMADDMRMPLLEPFLNWMGNIWVDRFHPSPHALISAVRHLRSGGAIGIFPEGRVPEPAHEIRPFLPGLGHMVVKGKARVLVAIVDGTPHTHELGQDLFTRSHSTLHLVGVMDVEPTATPDEVSDAVRAKLIEASGSAQLRNF